jgi:hypothetical protein
MECAHGDRGVVEGGVDGRFDAFWKVWCFEAVLPPPLGIHLFAWSSPHSETLLLCMSPVLIRGSRLFRRYCVLEYMVKVVINPILQCALPNDMNLGITSNSQHSQCSISGE